MIRHSYMLGRNVTANSFSHKISNNLHFAIVKSYRITSNLHIYTNTTRDKIYILIYIQSHLLHILEFRMNPFVRMWNLLISVKKISKATVFRKILMESGTLHHIADSLIWVFVQIM